RKQLRDEPPDVILSDNGFPSFSGFTALDIVREKFPALPFIFVSGSNDPGMVAEMYDRGATDYVFKNDLHDLPEAVRHALAPEDEAAAPENSAMEQPAIPIAPPPGTEPELPPSRLFFCPACLNAFTEAGEPVAL